MSIKVIADSGCDLNDKLKKEREIDIVPLSIQIDDKHYKDDEQLDIKDLLNQMKNSVNVPKTASPSPMEFIKRFKEAESIFVVTLSSSLSSTYNNALMAKEMYKEQFQDKFIHVFDSLSASVAETLISLKILELAKKNYKNLEIVEKVNEYINEMKTMFILESLENLIKSGRMSKLKGRIATALNIKPILGGNKEGKIEMIDKARGSKKAFKRLIELIGEKGEKLEEKILGIAHCNCLEKAEKFKEEVMKRYNFKDIIIVDTGGISTVYANDGGLIIAF
ncbi:fatty acid-binding protein DegV [Caloranaerobacter sp. TR13]|uniref:DegV family protein n=1 Tax=Caloranaerobacter sp. TR13 TaxID=1302151 RepID=UPI0006D3C5DA|nr:DegV family protein [Caloranaerobacter sp. TR13]KPU27732.1 fatty acid-binding protein DegV [Caloranaerobacter sp. TR13]